MTRGGDEGPAAPFPVADTLQAAWDLVTKNFVVLLGLSMVFVAVPRLVLFLAFSPWGQDAPVVLLRDQPLRLVVSAIVSVIGGVLLEAAVIRAAFLALGGERPDFVGCAGLALSLTGRLMGVAAIQFLGTLAGLALFIAPGLFLLVLWIAAVPALVAEGGGVLAAFGRSAALTEGRRWSLFGFLLVLAVVNVIVMSVMSLVASSIGLGMAPKGAVETVLIFSQGVSILTSAVLGLVNASAAASVYVSLRRVKEGAPPESFATTLP
jgi:hypothetical protein